MLKPSSHVQTFGCHAADAVLRGLLAAAVTAILLTHGAAAQDGPATAVDKYALDQTAKAVDDLAWKQMLSPIAEVEKVVYTGLPDVHAKAGTDGPQPMILYAYTFVPRSMDRHRKHPLIVFLHGGVHGSTLTGGPDNDGRLIRELVEQGYAVISPEYRGSSGYGLPYERAMDYGARENDDALDARKWMLERYPFLDPQRVGLVGWSHGGMIALMNVFQHPDAYACAGVPVSDLAERMQHVTAKYRAEMAASIGKDVAEDRDAYLKRSPVAYASQLSRPLLVMANTTDETVHFVEIEHLFNALDAAHRTYQKQVYKAAPGGHFFNRIDTPLAVESRQQVYAFLKGTLQP